MENGHGFLEINPRQLDDNPFQLIGYSWFLMTAEKNGVPNAMTVAWGGLGYMWGKPALFVAVRPERYTFEFMEAADTFSLTAFEDTPANRKMLVYFGTVSGRDEPKIAKSKLTVIYDGPTPYFAESRLSFSCKKIMGTVFQPEELLDQNYAKFYGGANTKNGLGGGYHTLYIAHLTRVLVKEGAVVRPMPKKGSLTP